MSIIDRCNLRDYITPYTICPGQIRFFRLQQGTDKTKRERRHELNQFQGNSNQYLSFFCHSLWAAKLGLLYLMILLVRVVKTKKSTISAISTRK
jgi:hypothetical protein